MSDSRLLKMDIAPCSDLNPVQHAALQSILLTPEPQTHTQSV